MTEIKIGKRTIPLFYSTYEMIAIQREIGCTAYQLKEEVFGVRQDDEDDPMSIVFDVVKDGVKTKKLGTLLRILGNAGLEEKGEEPEKNWNLSMDGLMKTENQDTSIYARQLTEMCRNEV